MNIFGWKWPKRRVVAVKREEPKKDLQELFNDYDLESRLLSFLGQKYGGNIPKHEYADLEKIEEQIVDVLEDELQKGIFRILARHRFNIVQLLREEDWQESLRHTCKRVCHFLHFGAPYPGEPEWEPLPFPGNEFFLWLLCLARGEPREDRIAKIFEQLKEQFEKEEIMGHKFEKSEIQTIGGRIIVVFAGEWAKQSKVLVDVLCELGEPGDAWIKELLELDS